ncbi:MAG: ATPase, T2SS/T4P/T4SS family [Candidatus Anstonellales archaeon]
MADNWAIKTILDSIAENVSKQKSTSLSLQELQEKYLPGASSDKVKAWTGELQALGILGLDYSTETLSKLMEAQDTNSIILQPKVRYGPMERLVESYHIKKKNIPGVVEIIDNETMLTKQYVLRRPMITPLTDAILNKIRAELIKIPIPQRKDFYESQDIMDQTYTKYARSFIEKAFPGITSGDRDFLADLLVLRMLGYGDIELLMADPWIEDICINGAKKNIWIYHRKHGWLITNLKINDDRLIREMAEMAARKTNQQISELNPLLDAQTPTGDRINATLKVVSLTGNTLTIRRFARKPWTIVDYINANQVSSEILALLWMAIQYELNFLIVGGTASGKTSFLNAISVFIPANHRIISIEDTRELNLPDFAHWVTLRSRPPNMEGKGEIKMLDLIINSLRMRPDRLIIGEIRKAEHVEVMFEAIHTGHSCYSTFHADDVYSAFRRLISPPLSINPIELEGLHGIVTIHRDRETGMRKVYEVAEMAPSISSLGIEPHIVHKYSYITKRFEKVDESIRIIPEIAKNTGKTTMEVKRELANRVLVLDWLAMHNVNDMNKIANVLLAYNRNPQRVLAKIQSIIADKEKNISQFDKFNFNADNQTEMNKKTSENPINKSIEIAEGEIK